MGRLVRFLTIYFCYTLLPLFVLFSAYAYYQYNQFVSVDLTTTIFNTKMHEILKTPLRSTGMNIDRSRVIFQESLTFETLTGQNEEEFEKLRAHLEESFPLFHENLEYKRFENGNMFIWKGTDETKDSNPALLLAHLDVVPAGDDSKWDVHPFSGAIQKGYIYGRGALDDKSSLVGMINAVELLLKKGYRPKRTIIFCFGEDEELGNSVGAMVMSKYLRDNGISPIIAIDEGGHVRRGKFRVYGIREDVALVSIAERGFMNVNVSVSCASGHSALPYDEHCVGILSQALSRLKKFKFKSYWKAPFFQKMVKEIFSRSDSWFVRLFFSIARNFTFFFDMVLKLSEDSETYTYLRTTQVPTMLDVSPNVHNIMPEFASANLNVRLHPYDSATSVLQKIRSVVSDSRVLVRFADKPSSPNNKISCIDCDAYLLVQNTIRQVFDDEVIVSPMVFFAATDLRWYRNISTSSYNFFPHVLDSTDLYSIHGLNERIKVERYFRVIEFYFQFVKNLDLL